MSQADASAVGRIDGPYCGACGKREVDVRTVEVRRMGEDYSWRVVCRVTLCEACEYRLLVDATAKCE